MAWYAGLITLVGTLIIFAVTKWLISSTHNSAPLETVAPKIYGMRKVYFFALSLFIVVSLFGSLHGLPYFPPNQESADYNVKVVGSMWAWEVQPAIDLKENAPVEAILTGKLVEFEVSATDVNHGIGIYNEAGQILTQTQAMPGYASKIYYRFDQPGTYQILCMEYCGSGHPVMNTDFTVTQSL
ncbi:MAG: hypothetical protein A2527_04900 [Candidatus Lambdaproteobacteria bacterium RIFOXYD2_FULL_50_16]|uniref:Cytochrome oxidase subunit II copper A binding domain-containing protein n=1 Tax=Candidatus Lambdaproteobacteria bacterium RIFOXYD2_FULL_50_16 TaxID=1817772 RepID=A0A1F6GBF7_9PROT|nr:MAG: hypothetical protein A2527_04900 [Candidatus Lambdaproteobacteria bacterium RIFOXYD2_FULL_50_16]